MSDLETSGAEAAHSPSSVDLLVGKERKKAWKGTEEDTEEREVRRGERRIRKEWVDGRGEGKKECLERVKERGV